MLKDTIISAFNYDGTLLKWLKKVEDALQNASASEFRVNKKGNATISFSIVFANGDTLESDDIILQQGESVTGATIRQGNLILTLSNGDELDAGNLGGVTSFSIDACQHLIVTYQNGSIQDLGAIFDGNVNINGNFTANSIIENMTGYSAQVQSPANVDIEMIYLGCCKNGNKLTIVHAFNITKHEGAAANTNISRIFIPSAIGNKIYPVQIGTYDYVDNKGVEAYSNYDTFVNTTAYLQKSSNTRLDVSIRGNNLVNDTKYFVRYEVTILLSENLAQ